jgi:wyosine [tRNA(Phe)-imidazoG37] synthetase (radical SAM superfamily)
MNNQLSTWFRSKLESICLKVERSVLSNKYLKCKVVFGPVRSRRLGLVLGINNLKPNVCSYDCIYCPGGKTSCCSISTNNCLSPYELYFSVKNKIDEIKKSGKDIDYILFAGSGDPALDSNLSEEIKILREFGYKIAIFTNSALLWNENIQENLMYADYVSLKVDTVNENTWSKINRPHQRLDYNHILKGIEQFSKRYRGYLTTATTLIKDLNDSSEEIEQLGKFLNTIKRNVSYFMTPIYPTAEVYAISPDTESLKELSIVINNYVSNSKMLCCPENNEFIATDDFENELLGLLELHPVNENAVRNFIKGNAELKTLNNLIANNIVKEIDFNGKKYLIENSAEKLNTILEQTC